MIEQLLYAALYNPETKIIRMVFRNDTAGQIIHPSYLILTDWMEQDDLINYFYNLSLTSSEIIKIEEFDLYN